MLRRASRGIISCKQRLFFETSHSRSAATPVEREDLLPKRLSLLRLLARGAQLLSPLRPGLTRPDNNKLCAIPYCLPLSNPMVPLLFPPQ